METQTLVMLPNKNTVVRLNQHVFLTDTKTDIDRKCSLLPERFTQGIYLMLED